MQDMADILTIIINPQKSSSSQNASSILTQSLMHELIFIGESRKACLHKKPESDPELGNFLNFVLKITIHTIFKIILN